MPLPGDTRAFLVDLSAANGPVNLQRARDEGGLDGIIQKVSEGTGIVDATAKANIEAAEKLGIVSARYGFCRPSQGNVTAEVALLWSAMGGVMPDFVAMDLENHPSDWSPTKVVSYGRDYLDALAQRFGGCPRVTYSYKYFFEHDLIGDVQVPEYAETALWIAWPSWPKPGAPPNSMLPPIPKPWTTWKLWQYSSDNSRGVPGTIVPGIPWTVDRNVYNGTVEELRAWCGKSPTPADEPTRIISPPVDFPVRTYDGADATDDTLPSAKSQPPVVIVHDEPDSDPPPQAA